VTFRGRVALVTGAGSGIGRLAAQRLAAQGALVAAVDRDAEALEVVRRHSPNVSTHVVDVTDAVALADCVARVGLEAGPVDRLVHAAGICLPGPLVEQPAADIERVMAVNYTGTVHAVKAVVDGMVERSRGDIVLLASMAGWVPSYRLGAYDASKFAVVAFGEVRAHELEGRGVRTVVVCPPPVDTPMLDAIRAADPRALGDQPSITAAAVLDAAEAALERGEVFAFPGRGTRAAVRVRRHAPGVLWRRLARLERGPASQPRHGAPPP
jgi:NAD(P)-dependent dehydrogenase (short-subunit alcohol dehydrogenase family)